AAAGFLRLGEAVLVELGFGARIAFAGARNQLGVEVMNLLELIAERLADPDRLAAEPGCEMPQAVVEQDVAGDEGGRSPDAVPHGVDDELRPALAPEVLRHLGGIRKREQPADFAGSVGDEPVSLADAEDSVGGAVLAARPADVTRLAKLDRDRA